MWWSEVMYKVIYLIKCCASSGIFDQSIFDIDIDSTQCENAVKFDWCCCLRVPFFVDVCVVFLRYIIRYIYFVSLVNISLDKKIKEVEQSIHLLTFLNRTEKYRKPKETMSKGNSFTRWMSKVEETRIHFKRNAVLKMRTLVAIANGIDFFHSSNWLSFETGSDHTFSSEFEIVS